MKNIKKFKLKPAFTLAEVLITLTIIGVIAAMTIPTLLAKHEKEQTVTKLKKAYSTLAQAFELSQTENGSFDEWNITSSSNTEEYVKKYWAPYLKVAKYCGTYQDCGYEEEKPWKILDGVTVSEEKVTTGVRYSIVLSDGVVVSFRVPSSANQQNGTAKINVDINGAAKPNRRGRDYFWMEIYNGKLRPYYNEAGANHGTYSNDCNSSSVGAECLYKIIQDGWKITNDYPW